MPTKPKKASEHQAQCALIQWAALNLKKYPELASLYAVPNAGKRSLRMGARMKAEGLRAGVPDLCLPVPRNGYGSLYIELKVKGGRVTELQTIWINRLRHWGNRVEVCYGWQEARDVLIDYLTKEATKCER